VSAGYEIHEFRVDEVETGGEWIHALRMLSGVRYAELYRMFGRDVLEFEATDRGFTRVIELLEREGVEFRDLNAA
jgi:hypothetical protein